MDENQQIFVNIPNSIGNLKLPDPELIEYYEDEKSRFYWLTGEINESTMALFRVICKYNKEDKDKPIEDCVPLKIMIDSTGGSVQIMLALVKAIKISKTPVYTIVYCNAMSAAAELLAAGHKRFAMPGTCVMVHSASYGLEGTAEQVESRKKYTDNLIKRSNDELFSNTKIEPRRLKRRGASDWFMDEEEAKELGIVDEIITNYDIFC